MQLKDTTRILMLISLVVLMLVISGQKLGLPVDAQESNSIRVFGFVNKPRTFTYEELLSFPMVSEVARLRCVAGTPDVTYDWTGIPLFYLLTLVEVRPEAVKIVTRGSGSFESDLWIKDALLPTTILALRANGTSLPELNGVRGLFRLAVPNKWGYKWVADIYEIEVTDNPDYLGTYEGAGVQSWTDEGDIPNSGPLPELTPPLQTLSLAVGNRTFEASAFTNASLTIFDFSSTLKEIQAGANVSTGTTGFVDFVIPQSMLDGPYHVFIDGNAVVESAYVNMTDVSFVYLVIPEGFHVVNLFGSEFTGVFPEIRVEFNDTVYLGDKAVFDAGESSDIGVIVLYLWSFGDGANAVGAVVEHSYSKVGTYDVELTEVNNNGYNSSMVFRVNVVQRPEYIPLALAVFLGGALGLSILLLIVLLLTREKKTAMKQSQRQQNSAL
jgi:hypothetical protein